MIAEYDGNNNLLRKYIYGPGIDQPVCMIEVADSNATYYYHFDALGSVVALSDAAGDTVQTYEYSVYGEVAVEDANHPNPYMFAGVRYDIEIGLYYNRARYYNPFTGRFLQTDPIGYRDGMNAYAYCRNNPGNFVDPSGKHSDEVLQGMAYVGGIWANNLPAPPNPGDWTSWVDFFGWYAHGEGVGVDLLDIGLLREFRLSDEIRPWTRALQEEMDEFAEGYAKLMLDMGKDQASTNFKRYHGYDFATSAMGLIGDVITGDPLVVLGGGELVADITITVTRDTDLQGNYTNTATWTLSIKYSMADEFKDPGDFFDEHRGEVEWILCDPYDITASWDYVNGGTAFGTRE